MIARAQCSGSEPLTAEAEFEIPAGDSKVSLQIPVDNVQLWWPNGYGEHPLYTISSEIYCGEQQSDAIETRIGFRNLVWRLTEDAPESAPNKMSLVLNGVPIRTMGSCLLETDLLPGRCRDRDAFFAEMAKECGINTLRHHGGTVVMNEAMYDACDRYGIMLLYDFPLGNCIIESDPEFAVNLDDTIRNITKQLRNHPSIIEWTGGNELWYWGPEGDRAGLEILHKAEEAEDGTRVFRDTSPIIGTRHAPWDYNPNTHYHHYNTDWFANSLPIMRCAEFGCQTPSNLETWYSDFPLDSQWPIDPENPTQWHKNVINAVFEREFWLLLPRIERFTGPADGIEEVVKGGQLIAGEGLRYACDAMRARGGKTGGFTTWDFNEPWRNGAGTYAVDYDGRPVMQYYFLKQALAPAAIQLSYESIFYTMTEDCYEMPAASHGSLYSHAITPALGNIFKTASQHWMPSASRRYGDICIAFPANTTGFPLCSSFRKNDVRCASRHSGTA